MRWFIERCTPETDVEHIRRWGEHMLLRADPAAAERLWAIAPAADTDLLDSLKTLTVPTLLLHGERDPFASHAAMAYLAAQLPNSRLAVLAGSGHVPAMIRPHDVAQLINDFFAAVR